MLFWILLGIAVVVIIIAFFVGGTSYGWGFEFIDAFMGAFIGAILSAIVLFVTMLILSVTPTAYHLGSTQDEYKLQALGTDSQINGRAYLLGGYVNESPVFSYVRGEGNGFVLRWASADRSTIFEGHDDAHLIVTTAKWGNPWLYPWEREGKAYDFYVPEGSVSNSFEVKP